uniref:Nucleoporin NUP35 n=1 Tax=Rhabditophanes sp. KR3021 TaxID=114890 RepID=A0AC35UAH7_9BILA
MDVPRVSFYKPPRQSMHNSYHSYKDENESRFGVESELDGRNQVLEIKPSFLFPNQRNGPPNKLPRRPIMSVENELEIEALVVPKTRKPSKDTDLTRAISYPPPPMSNIIHGEHVNEKVPEEKDFWVVVFGINAQTEKGVFEKMECHGKIVKKTMKKGASFFHIRYASSSYAKKALARGTFHYDDKNIAGVQRCEDLIFLDDEEEVKIDGSFRNRPNINQPLKAFPTTNGNQESQNSLVDRLVNYLFY